MTQKKSFIASAVSLALSSMMLSAGVNAGIIQNSNPTPAGLLGACGDADSDRTACVGAWDLGNVEVKLFKADGTAFPVTETFDEEFGFYPDMATGDTFASMVSNELGVEMGRVTGKVWPVGEPTGIKAVNNDTPKEGKPVNCLINTSYLGADGSSTKLDQYLNSDAPEPVICSSSFQTHKRFKIAMLPATVATVNAANEGQPIDMVFNVADEDELADTINLRPYQVFSKINNYTGKQLKGYKIVVGTGVGATFKSADELNIESKLFISLGVDEVMVDDDKLPDTPLVPGDLFDGDGLATFSHGLFGAPDKHFTDNGFFDERTAGFDVAQTCSLTADCTGLTYTHPVTGATVSYSDTIYSTGVLPSNYAGPANLPLAAPLFGDWLPAEWAPMGVFFDDDGDPNTDAVLQAWWDGTYWRKNYDSGFAVVSAAEFNNWAIDKGYSIDTIEDVLNLGLNYIVNVGDGIPGGKVTIRIIPVVADAQVEPSYVGTTPTPLPETTPVVPVTTSYDNGGCAIGGNGRFDPTLPALLAAGLGFFGWRRFKAGK